MGNISGKQHLLKIGSLIAIILIGGVFHYINNYNYQIHGKIQDKLIEHPENLPTKEMALATSFGFKNLRADLYWLQAIQYIGGNALASEYKKYLFTMLDLITELNPFFEKPYIIGELLLPSYNHRYEDLSQEEQEKYIDQGIEIGLKGVEKFCDMDKVERIKGEYDLRKIWDEQVNENGNYLLKNPCKKPDIAYFLAYIYFYYKHDPLSASQYYKIASANEDSVDGAKVMAAIMQGKGGNREKSYFMFLNIAKTVENENQVCIQYANQLEQIGIGVFLSKDIFLSGNLVKEIGKTRTEILGTWTSDTELEELSDTKCSNYVNKAVREINLAYIEQGNKKFIQEKGKTAQTAKQLFEEGYLDYLPVDFQQYEDYGIRYKYNKDIDNFDYEMWYE